MPFLAMILLALLMKSYCADISNACKGRPTEASQEYLPMSRFSTERIHAGDPHNFQNVVSRGNPALSSYLVTEPSRTAMY